MGHEIVGTLPRSQRWASILDDLEGPELAAGSPQEVALRTLENIASRYVSLRNDRGIQAAFQFLLSLPHCARGASEETPTGYPPIEFASNPSLVRLVAELKAWVGAEADSNEYADIATKAAADAMTSWTRRVQEQRDLFSGDSQASKIWSQAANGAAFCEVSRSFFAHLTERYLKYFLDRELSASLRGVEDRDHFDEALSNHLQALSQYAFETSEITKSFAAGWYNRHVVESLPPLQEVRGFVSYALEKIRDEMLRREAE